jgi:hypothetical protein
MKKLLLLIIFLAVQNATAQEAEVKKAIQVFFEGLHSSDTLKIKSVCRDDTVLQSINETANGARLETEDIAEFYKSIASIPADVKIEERLLDYKIRIDGTLAHAWTPYEFYVNGKLSHSGVDSFQLFRENGAWKIIYIVDTRRK